MVEFVSANPTGPLHVGHGRQAALGDAIANLLEWQGADVTREFYYNDAGQQIENLALSVRARARSSSARRREFPGGRLSRRLHPRARAALPRRGRARPRRTSMRSAASRSPSCAEQDRDLAGVRCPLRQLLSRKLAVHRRSRRRARSSAGRVRDARYEHDGALWLRTTDYGDDKDRVMRKSDGGYTYFVPDVAYHVTKWERGFAKVDQRAGLRPPQHGHARARRAAGARRRHPAGLSRTTCCTRW